MFFSNKKTLARAQAELAILRQYNQELKSSLKSIDQKLWALTQLTDPDAIENIIADLCIDMQKRMKAESDRINNIIIKELHNV